MIDKIINQADIPKNLTSYLNKNCHSSSPKSWPLLEQMLNTKLLDFFCSKIISGEGGEGVNLFGTLEYIIVNWIQNAKF